MEPEGGTTNRRVHVQTVAPGHCTGEPGFLALRGTFGDRYRYAGLGESVPVR